ncbi:nuclear transcription factor Y subunit A-7-like isoform X3 [Abrus precatorius]|uniref:Nuclear transcription factor Y subunit n=1 Tax=Abrus precatorius TaxID=3816 RepID=A0A8B8JEI0_ABRPR|nr:nuclear transcription factor Y subunit A-7-like isoform X3 [Abrus precatorius]
MTSQIMKLMGSSSQNHRCNLLQMEFLMQVLVLRMFSMQHLHSLELSMLWHRHPLTHIQIRTTEVSLPPMMHNLTPHSPMVHLQLMGIQQAGVPLPTDTVEEPVFVNAKQYHGILRRRQSRAKAESEKKTTRNRKPYLHESRHLHALRRARGCGGRFLNSKKTENQQNEVASTEESQSNASLNSDKNELTPSDRTS